MFALIAPADLLTPLLPPLPLQGVAAGRPRAGIGKSSGIELHAVLLKPPAGQSYCLGYSVDCVILFHDPHDSQVHQSTHMLLCYDRHSTQTQHHSQHCLNRLPEYSLAPAMLPRSAQDEATASVDSATDALIQSAVRRFASGRLSCSLDTRPPPTTAALPPAAASSSLASPVGAALPAPTPSHHPQQLVQDAAPYMPRKGASRSSDHGRVLLVIAHRVDTIIDMDHILVLGSGQVLEQGAPGELVASGGTFASMVAASRINMQH